MRSGARFRSLVSALSDDELGAMLREVARAGPELANEAVYFSQVGDKAKALARDKVVTRNPGSGGRVHGRTGGTQAPQVATTTLVAVWSAS
jgi:hypothetical protein